MTNTSTAKPLPSLRKEIDAAFWRAAAEERLLFQQCGECGGKQLVPRSWCSYCGEDDIEWVESEGEGTVYSFTIIRQAASLPAFEEDIPYVVAYVELDEGVRVCTNIVGCEPDDIEIGMPVEVRFDHVNDDIALPKFEPR
ncbi:MAG: Zn-ribbon domain-containing OB-fold protein [Halobacteriales archaeon]